MPFRHFNGTSDYIYCTFSGLSAQQATTTAVIVRPAVLMPGDIAYAITTAYGLRLDAAGRLILTAYTGGASASSAGFVKAGRWQLLVVTKAAGNAIPRFHAFDLATRTWARHNGTQTAAMTTVGSGIFMFGAGGNGGYNGEIATAAIWPAALTDGQVEALVTTGSVRGWMSVVAPSALWVFGQAAVTSPVVDLVGRSAQTQIAGTTAVAGAPPLRYEPSTVSHFDGTVWEDLPVARYDGSAWATVAGIGAL